MVLTLCFAFYYDTGDSLGDWGNGEQFSTRDQDNDNHGSAHCAELYTGAWWHHMCHRSNLNGQYFPVGAAPYATGVVWNSWKGYSYSLEFTEMKIRRIVI